MNNFSKLYSNYYNLLYRDKSYTEEFQYIHNVILNNFTTSHTKNKSILDIGCGTGKHLRCFKDTGYEIAGVDLSAEMLAEAKKYLVQENNLLCCKASEFQFNREFEVITALFHVMNYQTENSELEKVFSNISEHLTAGGLFLFDFWYGSAVLTDQPVVRIKRLENSEINITRIAEPVMHYNDNIVDVNYELFIEQKATKTLTKLNEIHKMRYLFLPEIQYFAEKSNLSLVSAYKWLTSEPLSGKDWYGFVVLRKN